MQMSELNIHREDDLLTLTLNRQESANALGPDLVEGMIDVLGTSQDIRLCVIRGEGKHFCAGFDLADIERLSDGDLLWRFLRIEHLLQLVNYAPFLTMAVVQGQVVGAGADLCAACHHRIATADARFRMPGWNFELALGTRRLTRLIGRDSARDMLVDTKQVSADEALRMNLVTGIAEQGQWDELVAQELQRARLLPQDALKQMLALTDTDTRAEDFAAIVQTAGRPGLKDRVNAYRERVAAERKRRRDERAS